VQVQFSRDGNFLYTGARRDADLFCWDVRFAADVVYRLQREAKGTNQRIHFDIEPCGRHLASGEWPCICCCMQRLCCLRHAGATWRPVTGPCMLLHVQHFVLFHARPGLQAWGCPWCGW
jgi:hypothetical protein